MELVRKIASQRIPYEPLAGIRKQKLAPIIICLVLVAAGFVLILALALRDSGSPSDVSEAPSKRILLLGGLARVGSSRVYDTTESYTPDPVLGRRNDFNTTLLTTRRWGVAGVLGRTIILAGGRLNIGSTYLSSSEIYNPDTEQWTAGPEMSKSRHWPVGVVLGDRFMVCGGQDGRVNNLNSCEYYQLSTNTWTTHPARMSRGTHASTGVHYKGDMFVIGGWERSSVSSGLEHYSSTTGTWSNKASMSRARNQLAAAVLGDSIVACGGEDSYGNDLDLCEQYTVATDTWGAFARLKMKRDDHVMVNFEGVLYVMGGESKYGDREWVVGDSVEVYDAETQTWEDGEKMIHKREDCAAVIY